MKIKLPEILAALFLCLCDINPQISVYGLSERNYYNGVLYRQKHGSNLDIHNIPRYQRKRITSRNARDPSDSNTDYTTHSEVYLHDQRNSTVTKFREYRTPTHNKIKIRERRSQDKFSGRGELNFKAVIGYEKQSLTLEIDGEDSQCSTTGQQCKTSGGFKMIPAAPSYRRCTTHQTARCTTTGKIYCPFHQHFHQTISCERTSRPACSTCGGKAVVFRIGSNTTVVFPVTTTPYLQDLSEVPPPRVLLEEVALAPSKENNVLSPVPLDPIGLATIQSLLEEFQRFMDNGTMDNAVVNQTDTHLKSNFTTPTDQEKTDQPEIKVSPPSSSTTESLSQERSSEQMYGKINNSAFTDNFTTNIDLRED